MPAGATVWFVRCSVPVCPPQSIYMLPSGFKHRVTAVTAPNGLRIEHVALNSPATLIGTQATAL